MCASYDQVLTEFAAKLPNDNTHLFPFPPPSDWRKPERADISLALPQSLRLDFDTCPGWSGSPIHCLICRAGRLLMLPLQANRTNESDTSPDSDPESVLSRQHPLLKTFSNGPDPSISVIDILHHHRICANETRPSWFLSGQRRGRPSQRNVPQRHFGRIVYRGSRLRWRMLSPRKFRLTEKSVHHVPVSEVRPSAAGYSKICLLMQFVSDMA